MAFDRLVNKSSLKDYYSISVNLHHSLCRSWLTNHPSFSEFKDDEWINSVVVFEGENIAINLDRDDDVFTDLIFKTEYCRNKIYQWMYNNQSFAPVAVEKFTGNIEDVEMDEYEVADMIAGYYESGQFEQLHSLLQKGYSIDSQKVVESMCFSEFNIEKMEQFAKMGFDVNITESPEEEPYWYSFFYEFSGNIANAERILNIKGLDINAGRAHGHSFFTEVLSILDVSNDEGFAIELISLLYSKGINTVIDQKHNQTPLFYFGAYPAVTAHLIELGENINHIDANGMSPLAFFCFSCKKMPSYSPSIKAFTTAGADINALNNMNESAYYDSTPLSIAITNNKIKLVADLIYEGANKKHIFKNGECYLELALNTNNPELVAMFVGTTV